MDFPGSTINEQSMKLKVKTLTTGRVIPKTIIKNGTNCLPA